MLAVRGRADFKGEIFMSRRIPGYLEIGAVLLALAAAPVSIQAETCPVRSKDQTNCAQVAVNCPNHCAVTPDADGDGVVDSLDQCPNTGPGVRVDKRGCAMDFDGDGVPYTHDLCWNTPAGTRVDGFGCPGGGLPRVLFEFNSADLTPIARGVIERMVAPGGMRMDQVVLLIGYTDSLGGAAYNQRLSLARAIAVKSYIEQLGVQAKIRVMGKGEKRPVASNRTSAGRALNRRVEIDLRG